MPESEYRDQLEEIEQNQKVLQDSLAKVVSEAQAQEQRLLNAIEKDLEIIDDLNKELTKSDLQSRQIIERIRQHKKEIDKLWNTD